MKTIIAIFVLLPSVGLAQVTSLISIGKVPSKNSISIAYMKSHPFLSIKPGCKIKSFTLSYTLGNSAIDKKIAGNNFLHVVPMLSELHSGQKIFFDDIYYTDSLGVAKKADAYFYVGEYDELDQIYIGRFYNHEKISINLLSAEDSLRHIDPNYTITQFSVSYESNVCFMDRQCKGNKLGEVLQWIQRIPNGKKIYFDRIKLVHKKSNSVQFASAVFVVQN